MNLNPHRAWITPLVTGVFVLIAVTGVLMFFHIDRGLNKLAHEWLGWVMVVGVGLHVVLNLPAFKRYLGQKTAWVVMGVFFAVLALSFMTPPGGKKEPSFAAPVHALARTPLSVLAQVMGKTPEDIKTELGKAGLSVDSDDQTLQDLVGTDLKAQIRAINRLAPKPGA